MGMIQLIIGAWTLLMIFVLCFEDCRAYLKNIVESLIYEWNSLYKDTKDEKGICLACFLMLFITLILLFCCLLFFPLLPLLSVCFVFRNFRNNDTDDTWLREQQEREENYRQKWNKFKRFHYPGKVSFEFDADTYIYVENRYDDSLNQCIRENLDEIKAIFRQNGFRFIYLPQWKPDTSLNSLANLTEERNRDIENFLGSMTTVEYTKLLCKVLHLDWAEMESGIFHFACFMYDSTPGMWNIVRESRFTLYPMQGMTEDAISIIISMYFYVTGISITDLEMAGHDVSEIIAPESISISHHCCRLYSVTNDGRYSGIAAESIDVRELPEEKRIKILKKCIVKLLGYDPKKSAFSKQRHWEAIYRIAADKGFIIDGDYAYFKSIIDGMQLSNIPVPFNTDLLERLNQGIYAKNIRDWSSEGLDGKKLQEYKDIKNCADAFNRVVDETTQQKENL